MAGKFKLSDHIQPARRDIGDITANILAVKREAGSKLLELGRCLIEAKAVLTHGEWLPWLENQVGFSERAAQQYMKLAREYTNPQALADLGATKALMLLALPEGEREEFIEVPHPVADGEKTVREMSTRELEKALREREEALAEKSVAEQARQKMAQDMAVAKQLLEAAQAERDEAVRELQGYQDSADAAEREIFLLTEQLEELKAKPVEVAVEVDQAAVEKARQETEASMRDKLDKAKAAQKKAEEKRKAAEAALSKAQAELEQAKAEGQAAREQAEKDGKRTAIAANEDLALFQVLLGQVQDEVNKMSGVLMKVRGRGDADTAGRLQKALLALADRVRGCAE